MHSDNHIVRRFIENAGNLSQSFGMGRAVGQVYAYLYFSPGAKTLDDITEGLGISKGSASMTVRQLEQWGAVQRLWMKGDRKDYYQAQDWFGRIIRNAVVDNVGKKMESHTRLLEEAEELLAKSRGHNGGNGVDEAFLRERVARLRAFHKKIDGLWNNPLVQMLLK